ncbi:hypothetical protein [Taibaiella koreensis]|uniref:hypothetical protein n=1 Tax=Taibaiella koreensis TaxID=1268548 RepID=UPI000E5A02D3|nr:hypothetical protein [Taibaiella koreensis]
MKKILQLAVLCAGIGLFAVSSSSCSSQYDATPQVPGRDTIKNPLRGTFTAVVDGETFVANSKYVNDATVNGVRTLMVSGVMDSKAKDPKNNKAISMTITNYMGPGTYPIQMGTVGLYAVQSDGTYTNFLAKTGDETFVVTITKDQGDVEGTFNFVVAPGGMGTADNHTISSGTFSIPK